jgi:hypothetical protein
VTLATPGGGGFDRTYNVIHYGATGDGTTDDTVAIQAAVDAVPATGGQVIFPIGIYKLTDTITLPDVRGIELVGRSSTGSKLLMTADNRPIIETQGMWQRGQLITNLRLTYDTQQTFASHPNSFAIALTGDNDGSFYHSTISRLYIERATVGIGLTAANNFSFWNNIVEDIQCACISYTVLSFYPASTPTAVGQPTCTIRDIKHLDDQLDGSPVVPTGPAFKILASAWVLQSIDIEDWKGQIFYFLGSLSLEGFHIERYTASNGVDAMFLGGTGPIEVSQGEIIVGTVANAVSFILYRVGTASIADINTTYVSITGTGTGSWYHHICESASFANVTPPQIASGKLAPAEIVYPDNDTRKNTRLRNTTPGGTPSVTAAATVTLPEAPDFIVVSGNTNIDTFTGSWCERVVHLYFFGTPTVGDGTGNLTLAGAFNATGGDTLTLICNGLGSWFELSRSVN